MGYLLFRDHNILPEQHMNMGPNQQQVVYGYLLKECEEREEAQKEQSN
jgi:hypothetical protein|nr:MAG TPA: hypothetical protein [Caudoviricetes sp.]